MVKKLLILLLLSSCALQSRKDQNSIRQYFSQKDFANAEKFLEGSSLKKKDNRLLYLMDKGTIAYYQEKYTKAAKTFNEANALVDELYTKSIRKEIAAAIINDNSKTFYGSIYERSMLFYYQAMSFYQIAKQGFVRETKLVDGKEQELKRKLSPDETRKYLNRVRSSLIAWNSFFQEMNRIRGSKTFLKNDFFAKFAAAQLHEVLNTKRDREIALILYREAYDLFKQFGPTYKIFNDKYKDYNGELRDYFDKKKKKSEVKSHFPSKSYGATEDFLKEKILDLTQVARRGKFKQTLRKLGMKDYKYERPNVLFQIESKMINPTQGKDYSLNLRTAIEQIEDPGKRAVIEGIGVPILTLFALGPLGLGAYSHHGNVTVFTRHSAGEALTKEVGIEFELPHADANKEKIDQVLVIKQGEKVIKEVELDPVISLSDVAFVNAQERVANSFSKRAARVGIKYAMAIAAAYATYKKMEDKSPLLARPAAFAQFLVSQKAIKESEKADARHWTTLPNLMLSAKLNLKPGVYQVYYKQGDALKLLNTLKIKPKRKALFTHRLF